MCVLHLIYIFGIHSPCVSCTDCASSEQLLVAVESRLPALLPFCLVLLICSCFASERLFVQFIQRGAEKDAAAKAEAQRVADEAQRGSFLLWSSFLMIYPLVCLTNACNYRLLACSRCSCWSPESGGWGPTRFFSTLKFFSYDLPSCLFNKCLRLSFARMLWLQLLRREGFCLNSNSLSLNCLLIGKIHGLEFAHDPAVPRRMQRIHHNTQHATVVRFTLLSCSIIPQIDSCVAVTIQPVQQWLTFRRQLSALASAPSLSPFILASSLVNANSALAHAHTKALKRTDTRSTTSLSLARLTML
jgi:hypothetical protein